MPESVRSLVQRKIDALDDGDRRLLGAASVQGIDFDSAILAAVLERPEEEVEDRLDRLEREHALVRFVDEQEAPNRELTLRYRFAHHVYHNAFDDVAARDQAGGAEPRDRAAADRAARRAALRLRRGHCAAARVGARERARRGVLEPGGAGGGAALRARRDRAARAARAGAARRQNRTPPRRRPRSSACR